MRARGFGVCVLTLGLFLPGPRGTAQEKDEVYRNVSSDKLETLMKAMNISFKKTPGKKDGIYFYDYERNNYKVRLQNFNGKDLWIDAIFNDKSSLDEVNQWNQRAKFSRAVLVKNNENESISLEAQLDCIGGVTDGMVRQFINRFDSEITTFVKFLNNKN